MADVEISTSIQGLQTALSEIEQLKQALSSLNGANSGGIGSPMGGGSSGGHSGGNYANNVSVAIQENVPQAAALPTNMGLPVTQGTPPPVISTNAASTNPYPDRYGVGHVNDELIRVHQGYHGVIASGANYAGSMMGDIGLGPLATGMQQVVMAILDTKRIQSELVTLGNRQVETLKALEVAANRPHSGGGGNTTQAMSAATGTSATQAMSVAPEAEAQAAATQGGVSAFTMGLARAVPWIAGAYALVEGGKAITNFAQQGAVYRSGGLADVGIQQQAQLNYYQQYGAREQFGFGSGLMEQQYYKDLRDLETEAQERQLGFDMPMFRGTKTPDGQHIPGLAGELMKRAAPDIWRQMSEEARRQEENKRVAREAKYRYEEVYGRTLTSYGLPNVANDDKRYAYDVAERLGLGADEFILGGRSRDPSSGSLNRFGVSEEVRDQVRAILTQMMAENPAQYGSIKNIIANNNTTGQPRIDLLVQGAKELLLQGRNEDARDMFNVAQAYGRNDGISVDGSQLSRLGNQLRESSGYSNLEQVMLSQLTASRTSLEMLGGSREDIQSNMNMEGVHFNRRINELNLKMSATTNPITRGQLRSELIGTERQRDLAGANASRYEYQTVDLRNYLTGSELDLGMNIAGATGRRPLEMMEMEAGSEFALMTRIQNINAQANDPRNKYSPEQRRQMMLQGQQMQSQLIQRRKTYFGSVYGLEGAEIGLQGSQEAQGAALAELFGDEGDRTTANFEMLKSQRRGVNLLERRLGDIDSGLVPASAQERTALIDQLTQSMTKLTLATESAHKALFAIPAQTSQMRQGISATTFATGIAAGFGGVVMAGEYASEMSENTFRVENAQAEVDNYRKRGYAENSLEMLRAKQNLVTERKGMVDLGNKFASSPISSATQGSIERGRFEMDILNMLPGSIGSRRTVMGEQMDSLAGAIGEIQTRQALQKQSGELTPEQDEIYKRDIRGIQSQRVGLFAEMSYGWQGRLASTMVNAPGNFAGIAPGLAYRAAVGSGVRNPLFGSSALDVPDFAGHAGLMGSIAGGGSPMGQAISAMTRGSRNDPMYVRVLGSSELPPKRPDRPVEPGSTTVPLNVRGNQ